MLSSEWAEFADLFDNMSDLLGRYSVGRRGRNVALLESLEQKVASARQQHEQILKQVAAQRLSVFSNKWCMPSL
ncbi:MAG TPA: hypothetical protein VHY35_25060 [Stellaceae bacterium]|nr:hypothetical protein [Stellaceae bacterium]